MLLLFKNDRGDVRCSTHIVHPLYWPYLLCNSFCCNDNVALGFLRRVTNFYCRTSTINVSTCMRSGQKKSKGTNNEPSNRDASRSLRHHPKPTVHPANMNVLTSVMERKQVQETSARQTYLIEFSSSHMKDNRKPENPNLTLVLRCARYKRSLLPVYDGFGLPARR